MALWLIAIAAGIAGALIQYGRLRQGTRTAPLALLRTVSIALVVALLLSAPIGSASTPPSDVALDASLSWTRASDSSAWRAARDSAAKLGGSSLLFGDSLRAATASAPTDNASRVRAVVDASTGSGRPAIIITDGELEEPELLSGLPRGSRTIVIPRKEGPDLAVSSVESPRALLVGDTIHARATLVAGSAGAPAAKLEIRLDDALIDTATIPALPAFAERVVPFRGVISGAERAAVLHVAVRAAGDREARNDSLAIGVDVTKAAAAVFISTSPDYDAREAVAALRGVTSLPTRAFYRVAPGMWRSDGGLTRTDEADVRAAVRDAPVVVMHGDTSVFGAPRMATRGALLLFAPPATEDGEFFAFSTPVSPIAPSLGGMPFDSLPPITVAPLLPRAEWQGLLTRRGGSQEDQRPALVGWESPRRIAVLGASGLWRWRFRGGVRSDAYAALMGALYDWLAEGRTDRRAVVPDGQVLRAGSPVRWRRGAPADSTAAVVISRRGAQQRDSITVHFTEGAVVAESPALAPGIYDVTTAGGVATLAVNASPELIPHRITVKAGKVGGEPSLGDAPLLREKGWAYALVILLLCGEWLLRRRAGLR
jgi:hypothetical protein